MQALNTFIIGFCVSCIALGFLYFLCPAGSMNASVKYVFCLCFVCCILASVMDLPKIELSFFEQNQNLQILTEENTATTAQLIFGEALNKQNINFKKITVETNKLADNSIGITKVTVYTDELPNKVYEVLDSKNYEVVVINE